jgi:hypothetical protein
MLNTDAVGRPPSEIVMRRFSDVMDVSPTELPPLYAAIDPDALDRFVANATSGTELGFDYCGLTVTVAVRERDFDVTVTGQSP